MASSSLTEQEDSNDCQSKSAPNESSLSEVRSHLSRRQSQATESEETEDEVDWRTLPALATPSPVDRSLGLTWKNLTIKGAAAGGTINENVSSQFFPPFLRKDRFAAASVKTIINNSSGCVKPGEMLLVLG